MAIVLQSKLCHPSLLRRLPVSVFLGTTGAFGHQLHGCFEALCWGFAKGSRLKAGFLIWLTGRCELLDRRGQYPASGFLQEHKQDVLFLSAPQQCVRSPRARGGYPCWLSCAPPGHLTSQAGSPGCVRGGGRRAIEVGRCGGRGRASHSKAEVQLTFCTEGLHTALGFSIFYGSPLTT